MREIDCPELQKLVRNLHSDTTVRDLIPEEKELVFPDMMGEIDKDLRNQPGGMVDIAVRLPSYYTDPETEATKLKNLYEKHCE